jgi:hypothetical protein
MSIKRGDDEKLCYTQLPYENIRTACPREEDTASCTASKFQKLENILYIRVHELLYKDCRSICVTELYVALSEALRELSGFLSLKFS